MRGRDVARLIERKIDRIEEGRHLGWRLAVVRASLKQPGAVAMEGHAVLGGQGAEGEQVGPSRGLAPELALWYLNLRRSRRGCFTVGEEAAPAVLGWGGATKVRVSQ